ncbi:hypothetical protein HD596_000609 [Nonomuraea jabiensis]|uniref:Uncharacterized protein n=1 Tax=Nonomuraea jabiensis TaxID=882448 RepID=A0A7W9FYG5_9ACTN|nr:hypothetical protein [Nonomuraea jabiensis]
MLIRSGALDDSLTAARAADSSTIGDALIERGQQRA